LLAGRYRVVALLGRGGMGEVYRAEDLTLGQPVALKFLPEAALTDEMLARFRNEVKIARRVSHPNVCRVYDIGEADGRHFLSMEYVDGEDLASLLRRIGRLPADKALEVARKVCAGLAAAHDKGVLHRDLKPANVMLDGRGNVVLTDFGLAGLAGEIAGEDVRSGTPAYMAPEQLAGLEVTPKSDIYSLGLVLYEIFTGKRAFEGKTLAEVQRHRSGVAPTPSSVVRDLDPAVESAILRCLEAQPSARPASVLAVAAGLPGGDPLAAALAAGQTPAPQVVADAGQRTGLTPRAALASFLVVVVGLTLIAVLLIRASGLERMSLDQPPEVLAQRSREIIRSLGYDQAPADTAQDFDYDGDFIHWLESQGRPRWDEVLAGRPSPLYFWYRTSPQPMTTQSVTDDLLTPGVVRPTDPPPTLSGMIHVELDPKGRLTRFQAIPPEKEEGAPVPRAPDWNALFAAAGLDPAALQPADPSWVSLAAFDTRAAWTGTWPGTSHPLRVEAAAWRGAPVSFALIGPWTKPARQEPADRKTGERAARMISWGIILVMLVGATLLARQNYARGRGDRRGALSVALAVFCLQELIWLCRVHLVLGDESFLVFLLAVAHAFFIAGVTWVLYMSFEPYVRRHWPERIISWSRVITGRPKDPLVGRDVLLGVLLGIVWVLIFQIRYLALQRLGAAPWLGSTDYLVGGRGTIQMLLVNVVRGVRGALEFFFLLFLLRVVLRRQWLAALVFVALFSTAKSVGSDYPLVEVPTMIIVYTICALAVLRFGLVGLAAGIFTVNLLLNVPLTANLSSWYAGSTFLAFASVLALAAWGFHVSRGGASLWRGELFE
jgi:serine/threonine-protein kinase